MNTPMDPNTAQPSTPVDSLAAPTQPATSTNPANPQSVSGSGVRGKEIEGGVGLGGLEIPELTEVGKDIELPKDVEAAGVKVTPTNISIPKSVQNFGVTPVGQKPVVQQPIQAQPVPLTDDQITKGLKQGVKSSWRWLAEWCVRKLKQLHGALIG